jgi:phage-related protein (TIGR01555 family)
VLVFHGRLLPYRPYLQNAMWGDSELQHVIDDVKDYSMVMAMLATMFFEANVDVLGIANLAQMLSLPGGEDKVNKRFNIAAMQKSANRMLMMDAQDKYDKKGNNFTGVGTIVDDFRANVAAASMTPQTKLFGIAPGGLSRGDDVGEQNYYASVAQAQKTLVRRQVTQAYKLLLINTYGAVPPGFRVAFNSLYVESAAEMSTRQSQDAQRDATYIDAGVIGAHTVAKELKEKKVYATLEDAEVQMVKDLEEQATEDQMEEAKKQAALLQKTKGAPDKESENPGG